MSNLKNIKGWYVSNSEFSVLKESSEANKPKDVYIQGLLLPRDKVSRNSVLYDWSSIVEKHKELIGKPMLFNHDLETTERPLGTVVDSWLKEYDDDSGVAGWYYKSRLNPRSQYYDDVLDGFINKVSIQINARDVVQEYMQDREYERAYIDDILEISGVNVPGFPQTSIETLIAEAVRKEKQEIKIKENTEFPYDMFKKGLEQELGEHPKVSVLDAAQLVLDHLKEDMNYYSKNSDAETKTEDITTATAVGAMAPTTLGSNDDKKEDDKMSKDEIIKKESESPEDKKDEDKKDEETDKKLEESVDEDKKDDDKEEDEKETKKLSESVKKEEYETDMSNITDVLEKFNTELSSLRAEISDLKTKIVTSEDSVDTDSDDIGVAPEDQKNADNIVTPGSENSEAPEKKSDKDDEVEEPIPPKLEKAKTTGLKENVVVADAEPELSGQEAFNKYLKERFNL
jgi:hypothetical protein